MAKRRIKPTERSFNRADVKAAERRAAATTPLATPARTESAAMTTGTRTGVLPARAARAALAVPTISREDELRFITTDLRQLVILGVVMLVMLVVLTFFLH